MKTGRCVLHLLIAASGAHLSSKAALLRSPIFWKQQPSYTKDRTGRNICFGRWLAAVVAEEGNFKGTT